MPSFEEGDTAPCSMSRCLSPGYDLLCMSQVEMFGDVPMQGVIRSSPCAVQVWT